MIMIKILKEWERGFIKGFHFQGDWIGLYI